MTIGGTWKAPKNADIFRAAVSVLHVAHGQRDSYKEPCVDCKANPEGKLHQGCSKHPENPQVFRCGNPTKDSVFENTMAQLKKDDHDYKEQGSYFRSTTASSPIASFRPRVLSLCRRG